MKCKLHFLVESFIKTKKQKQKQKQKQKSDQVKSRKMLQPVGGGD